MTNVRRKNQKSDNFSDADVSPMNVNINIQCTVDPTNPDSNGLKCKISRDPVHEEDKEVRGILDFSPEDEEDDDDEIVKEKEHDHKKKKVVEKKSKTLSRKAKDEDEDDDDDDEDKSDSDDESDEDSDDDDYDDSEDEEVIECISKSTMKKR